LAAGLLCLPLLGWTQGSTQAEADIWRKANDAVGQFKRGHADVLQWEQRNAPAQAAASPAADSFAIGSAEDVIKRAWKAQPQLGPTIARLDAETMGSLLAGHWDSVDPRWLRRAEDMGEVLRVAAQARRDFVTAVAAHMVFQLSSEMLTAAESARELGDRMVRVGNWSKMQQAPLQIAQAEAQMHVYKFRLAWVQTQSRLLKSMGQAGLRQTLTVPTQLPDLPKQIRTEEEVRSKSESVQQQLFDAQRFANRDHVFQAFAAYQAAFANANLAKEVLELQQFVTDETVLHYNGMLKSTWDVLAQSQSQIQASIAAVDARRDFELAQIDLEWVLLGGEPGGFVSLGGGDGAPAAASP
jgi:outer membrane protein TolC